MPFVKANPSTNKPLPKVVRDRTPQEEIARLQKQVDKLSVELSFAHSKLRGELTN